MFFDTDERTRRAVRIRAGKDGVNPSDVVLRALEEYLPLEFQEADEAIARGGEPPKSKRGRKPKSD